MFLHFYFFILSHFLWLANASSSSSSPLVQANEACKKLNSTSLVVAFPNSSQYEADITHWALSSQQNASCSVEPNTAAEVSTIIKIINETRTPFAVKSGGHAYNPGFSSTFGVQISMTRFNEISYDIASSTVKLGVGLTWDQVYEKLDAENVTVAGGRIPGVGVGGLSLGGGYSWITDERGLTIDTIVSYELVLPSGQISSITNLTNPELFFALKGGLNNFGIVTTITLRAFPSPIVTAGVLAYAGNFTDAVHNATANFSLNNKDVKATIVTTYAYLLGEFLSSVILIYNGDEVPDETFEEFLNIPSIQSDYKPRSFYDFIANSIQSGDPGIGDPFVVGQHVIPVLKYTVPILEKMAEEVEAIGQQLSTRYPNATIEVTCSAEPFVAPNAHSLGGAYPHPPSRQVTPASPFIALHNIDSQADYEDAREALVAAVEQLSHNVQAVAVAEGQSRWSDLLYPNYAIKNTPLELMYGDNVPKLDIIAQKYDPFAVMQLTGGFKFGLGTTA